MYKDKALQKETTKNRVRRYRQRKALPEESSKVGADLQPINNDTVSQLHIRLSDTCTLSWLQFKQSMIGANEGYYNFIPLSKQTTIDKERLKRQFDNRYKKPTKEELDNYPVISIK
jgi:hypothetical protein